MTKKILYVDMDNVLVDFQSGLDQIDETVKEKYEEHVDDIPGIFSKMVPIEGAIEAFNLLAKHFDTYVLTAAPWENPTALTDKRNWIKKYLPESGYKRLIITHHKNLNKGDFIVDDRLARGVDKFEGMGNRNAFIKTLCIIPKTERHKMWLTINKNENLH